MNLVSLLILPAILSDRFVDTKTVQGVGGFGHVIDADPTGLSRLIAAIALVVLIAAIAYSKRSTGDFGEPTATGGLTGVEEDTEPAEAVEEALGEGEAAAASSAVKILEPVGAMGPVADAPTKKATARKATAKKAAAARTASTKKAAAKKATTKKAAPTRAPAKKATKKR
jgi:hypothetical protein